MRYGKSLVMALFVTGAVVGVARRNAAPAAAPPSKPAPLVDERPAIESARRAVKEIETALAKNDAVLAEAGAEVARQSALLQDIDEIEEQYESGTLSPLEYVERRAAINARVLANGN